MNAGKLWRFISDAWQGNQVRNVDHGRVHCPYRGSVGVEECLACSRLVASSLGGSQPYVKCAAKPGAIDQESRLRSEY